MTAAYTKNQRLLTVDHVSLSYGPKKILNDINLVIDDIVRPGMTQGQVVSLLGPSGIGKTQLFRCIAGLQNPTNGAITLNGGHQVQAGDVGVVFQNYPLLKHRTVWGNLKRAADSAGKKPDDIKAMLERFGLADKGPLYPIQLSGGQRQRVAIIQQLLCSSHFILMDEPFSGLDILAKRKVQEAILEVSTADELNTVIITTHGIEEAVAVSDMIWVLGRKEGVDGAVCVAQIDLIERDLCWHTDIEHHPAFHPTVMEIKALFK
jgi:ABC-type nitrate/sulfonate/bicarbonate transport system ATPase subunit